jgi:hypothetical protein
MIKELRTGHADLAESCSQDLDWASLDSQDVRLGVPTDQSNLMGSGGLFTWPLCDWCTACGPPSRPCAGIAREASEPSLVSYVHVVGNRP